MGPKGRDVPLPEVGQPTGCTNSSRPHRQGHQARADQQLRMGDIRDKRRQDFPSKTVLFHLVTSDWRAGGPVPIYTANVIEGEDPMAFDLFARQQQREAERVEIERKEREHRDALNAGARMLTAKINEFVGSGSPKAQATVEENVVTVKASNDALVITVVDKETFAVQEKSYEGGFNVRGILQNLIGSGVNEQKMLDALLDWLDKKK
jgi:hypothetical protein